MNDEVPDTVDALLGKMAKGDLEEMGQAGRLLGSYYNGVVAECGDRDVAVILATAWITAVVSSASEG